MSKVRKFLERLRDSIQAEGVNLSKHIEALPSPIGEAETLREIVSCYETISWYHTFVSAKIYRALTGKMEKSDDKELAQLDQDDADGSAKVASEGLIKSMVALKRIYEWDKDLQDDALTLLVEVERLRKGIDIEFPGHRKFKRPGFEADEVG